MGKYIRKKGINLSEMSRQLQIPYQSLYSSLVNPSRHRELRGIELLKICAYLDKDPREFA